MGRSVVVRRLDGAQRAAITRLLGKADAPPLSDHLSIDLHDDDTATYTGLLLVGPDGALAGYGQLQPGNGSWSMELVVATDDRDWGELTAQLVADAVAHVGGHGGGTINWWVLHAIGAGHGEALAARAESAGFTVGRRLHQMRRALPLDVSADVAVRSFVVGRDEGGWLRVNNAALAGHPEQGGWDPETLAQREAEPWFDPGGFLLHERDGRLAAFCWTKVHETTRPPMGEIYVIGVDPVFHGLGLGRASDWPQTRMLRRVGAGRRPPSQG